MTSEKKQHKHMRPEPSHAEPAKDSEDAIFTHASWLAGALREENGVHAADAEHVEAVDSAEKNDHIPGVERSLDSGRDEAAERLAASPRPENAAHFAGPKRHALRTCGLAAAGTLCVAALLAGTVLTYSAYTGNAFLKGVEVTKATQSLFASDMLSGYYTAPADDAIDSRSVVVSTTGDTCSFTFRIYNCLLDDQQVVNDKDVPYTLAVTAAGVADGAWSVSPAAGSVTLAGNQATIKSYTVTFPKSALGGASFTVKATVDISASNIGTKLACLAARIVPNAPSEVEAASVSGDLVDGGGAFAEYDAYNYRVTVTGVETRVRLSWDTGACELDPYFGVNHVDADIDSAAGTATFAMQPGSTIVNLYRKEGSGASSWADLGIHIEKAD